MSGWGDRRAIPYYLAGLGVGLGASAVLELMARPNPLEPSFLASLGITVPFAVLTVASGYWLTWSDVPPGRYRRVVAWVVGGASFFLVFFVVFAVVLFGGPWDRLATIRLGASIGVGGGSLIGVFEARTIQEVTAAERAAVRAEEHERRRELLNYLNSLLRHEVLNTANVIGGYARLIAESDGVDDQSREHAAVIRRQTDELSAIITDVRQLLEAAGEAETMEPVDLDSMLRAELRTLQDRHRAVDVDAQLEGDVTVAGDALTSRIFSNLLDNAVEHNDSECPRVSVSMSTGPDTATVRVADDGPGVPDEERESLFEHTKRSGPDHGLGLAIVDTLAQRYGGSVELTESTQEGSVFTVELPRWQQAEAASRSFEGGDGVTQ